MRFKFTKDKTYNPIGANHTRVDAKAGEVHDLPAYLCQMLSEYGSIVGAEPSEQPQAAPKEQKSYSMDHLGGGWYAIKDEDGIVDKIRGKEDAYKKLNALNE